MEQSRLKWNGWGWSAHKEALADNETAWTNLARALNMPALLATPARALEDIALTPPKLETADRDALTRILGEDRIREDRLERARHAAGRSYGDLLRLRSGDLSAAPDMVLYPRGADEVLAILRYAAEARLAVLPFGGGTGPRRSDVRGNFRAMLALNMTGMDRVLEIDKTSGIVSAEAGITGMALEKSLSAHGLTLGHRPECHEFSTLGGWIAGGSIAGKSHASDWFKTARLATPRGFVEVDESGLREMILASEGIFGVIVEARARLSTEISKRRSRFYLFRDMASSVSALQDIDDAGIAAEVHIASPKKTETDSSWPEPPTGLRSSMRKAWHNFRGYNGQSVRVCIEAIDPKNEKKLAKLMKSSGGRSLSQTVDTQAGSPSGLPAGSPYFRDALLDRGLGVAAWQATCGWKSAEHFCESVGKGLQTILSETSPRPGAEALVLYELSGDVNRAPTVYFTCIFPRALDDDQAQWARIGEAARLTFEAHGAKIAYGEGAISKFEMGVGTLAREALIAVKNTLDPNGILNPGRL